MNAIVLMYLMLLPTIAVAEAIPTVVHALVTGVAARDHLTDDAGDTSAYGKPVDMSGYRYGSIQANWSGLTGSINAVVSVEVSSDGVKWSTKSDASGNPVQFTLSGASGTDLISLNGVVTEMSYRARYAHNSVTGGTIDIYVTGK